MMIILLFFLGVTGGFLSGLLGVGGAVVMIPLALTMPRLVKAGELTMTEISGLSMIQVLVSSVFGGLIHKKNNFVNGKALLSVGIPMGFCALGGAYGSKYMTDRILLIFFGILALLAFFLLLLKKQDETAEADSTEAAIPLIPGVLIGVFVGFTSGAVGAGGGFILIPLMTAVLKIPLKTAVGTSLGIVFIGAVMGSAGKILSMQVSLTAAIPLIIGSLPAAQLGAKCSKMLKPGTIRYLLLAVVFAGMVKVWYRILVDAGLM